MARELLKDLIYGDQLVTDGCKVEFAVGLTYSLNLEAMLTVPLAFGELGELDSNVRKSPAFLLEGIRRAGDKIALFCNKGSIHVPSETKTIFSLLENSIFEVQNGKDIFSNFHPKLWLVKEVDSEGNHWLRLAVMSRNLDFSSCLDICCSLRGKIGGRKSHKGTLKHQPLKEMLYWVSDYADKNKAANVRALADELDYVAKFELDSPFQTEDSDKNEEEGYSFYPFVFNNEEFIHYKDILKQQVPGERILVVSPFIDHSTLSWLVSAKKDNYKYESANAILITRKEYVTENVFDLFDEVWVPNDTMVDNTTASIDLHAKMYLTHRLSGDDLGYTLYLGSANATENGFGKKKNWTSGNGEFLLRLHYKRTTNDRIKEMLEEFTSDHRFVKLDAPNMEASNERHENNDEIELKKSINCLKKATIRPSQDGNNYDISLTIRGNYCKNVKIRPLQCKDYWQPLNDNVEFRGLPSHLLSEFYVLSIPVENAEKSLEMVAKIDTSGIPQNRDESIFQSIVTKKEDLLNYVAFMLSDNPTEFFYEQQIIKGNTPNKSDGNSYVVTMPLYEQLLKKAAQNPMQIAEVQKFVSKMKPEIVPTELTQILTMFHNVSKQIEKL